MEKKITSLLFVLLSFSGWAQSPCALELPESKERMASHVDYLSSDALEGRYPGTAGADLALAYILEHYRMAGLTPLVTDLGAQPFTVARPCLFPADRNFVVVKEGTLTGADGVYPHPHSATAKVSGKKVAVGYGIVAPELQRNDFARKDLRGAIVLMDIGTPDGKGPHGAFAAYNDLDKRIDQAASLGAVGVLLYEGKKGGSLPSARFKNPRPGGIPVACVSSPAALKKVKRSKTLQLGTEIQPQAAHTANAVGYIDNKAERTLAIGAHYDHLGWGLEHSMHTGDLAIHNGADDNASGIAVLLEMARVMTQLPEFNSFNVIFAAFSGEEDGLLGSQHFMQNRPEEARRIDYMLNLDMVGRLEKGGPLTVAGTGTALEWPEILREIQCVGAEIKSESAPGSSSDHASFSRAGIPVLHFFTGIHGDYHRPSDDRDKINPDGMEYVLRSLLGVVSATAERPVLTPQEVKDPTAGRAAASFKVTLGVIPDYGFSGDGMRIAGVSPGRPAAAAGLKEGDIVVQIGTLTVRDMSSYMEALAAFKKGQKTKVVFVRQNERITKEITF